MPQIQWHALCRASERVRSSVSLIQHVYKCVVCVCVRAFIVCVYVCVCTCACWCWHFSRLCMCVFVNAVVCAYMCVCVCVWLCVWGGGCLHVCELCWGVWGRLCEYVCSRDGERGGTVCRYIGWYHNNNNTHQTSGPARISSQRLRAQSDDVFVQELPSLG